MFFSFALAAISISVILVRYRKIHYNKYKSIWVQKTTITNIHCTVIFTEEDQWILFTVNDNDLSLKII